MMRPKLLNFLKNNYGRIILLIIGIFLAFRLFTRECSLLLCGAFIGTVVVYVILSDYWSD
ncbi:MAG: hypothetical protein GXO86_05615 [Chlorobi bacterium]|nr:hypothetical protein [Chlorobiota bacterium]